MITLHKPLLVTQVGNLVTRLIQLKDLMLVLTPKENW
ncbi:hypothetical protein CY0110_17147 [Crocosphaera chwakensis CCY0110]|uniref:Uncharacterized protein n=1 Tax=Crocosphaera chwakensis CCY0110 TaxID=391612 RepID=A3IIB1_9CHRO|nr:hypothetical protein CY0110_17147 [Crocosphaera chwakensis CCY0110]